MYNLPSLPSFFEFDTYVWATPPILEMRACLFQRSQNTPRGHYSA